MTTVTVNSEAEAAAILARFDGALRDMRPFWDMLERPSGALDVGIRDIWDTLHRKAPLQPATVKARADGRGYYSHAKGPRATRSSPRFYWTGNIQKAASGFTETDEHRAVIDPDRNYQGPLMGVVANPYSDTVGTMFDDADIFGNRALTGRIERDLSAYLFKTGEGR